MPTYKKVLLKLSGEALANSNGGFSEENVQKVAYQVKELIEQGIEVGIVIGGGNFWRGRNEKNAKTPIERTKSDQIGMLGTVMNCLFAAEIFKTIGLATKVLTPFQVGTMTQIFEKEKCMRYQGMGTVVFFAGGTGHPYFSTDTAAALRAIETESDLILAAKNIDGVYDSDPKTNPAARKYDRISIQEVIDRRLDVVDKTAAIMLSEHKIPMLVFHLNGDNSIVKALNSETDGTLIEV